VINLYECECPGQPRADPSTCPADCPNVARYRTVVESDQVVVVVVVVVVVGTSVCL
jgi:hypothetical protein